MSKVQVVRTARGRRRTAAELSDAIEGRIAEICRDLAVQVKRMRQLQEQTDELRVVVREWVRIRSRRRTAPRLQLDREDQGDPVAQTEKQR
jgi:hypothetical protein